MATRPPKPSSRPRSGTRHAVPGPDLSADQTDEEEDLWFLSGPDEAEDLPPGAAPREGPTATLFDPAPWREAEAAHARELAEVAALFGALDQRQLMGPPGWRQRLALREVSDLGWWTGDRVDPDRLALWIALRVGSTRDNARALARAGWAVRRLTQGFGPEQGLSAFLERRPRAPSGPEVAVEDSIADLAEVMVAGEALHPVTAAARLFQAWGALGPDGAAGIEAAVLAARHAAGMAR
ncbi:hypothetical protein E0K89_013095, partial [Aquicoccus sp. SCR17]|nr:hypothetical protein [Carideicomes alvinocaridis]